MDRLPATDPIIQINLPVQQIESTRTNSNNHATIHVQTRGWICTISQHILPSIFGESRLKSDLEVSLAFQWPRDQEGEPQRADILLPYTHLSVTTTSRSQCIGNDRHEECLQEVIIHHPEMLFQGLKVYVDPESVLYQQRYVFRIRLHSYKLSRHLMQQQLTPSTSLCPSIPSFFYSNEVYMAAKHRLKEFLVRSVNADVLITFNQSTDTSAPTPSSSLSEAASHLSLKFSTDLEPAFKIHEQQECRSLHLQDRDLTGIDPAMLFVHSCIMSTVSSPAISPFLDNSCRSILSPSTPACTAPLLAPSHACIIHPHSLSHESAGVNQLAPFTFYQHPLFSSGSPQQTLELQFLDANPEAVRAVVRYIYLGQKPILEPFCEYTVKDLMALASRLQILPLEDYCVQLVLSTNSNNDLNYDLSRKRKNGYSDWLHVSEQPSSILSTGKDSRISPETAVQVLFDWGYLYAKIRTALVCALIDSDVFDENMLDRRCCLEKENNGKIGQGLLQPYEGHQAFHAIICEMVERMLSRRGFA